MLANKSNLKQSILTFLQSKDNYHIIKPKDQRFLLHALTEFVDNAANKFIAGGVEHADSDFLTECDHLAEVKNEIVDGWMYTTAIQYNKIEKAKGKK